LFIVITKKIIKTVINAAGIAFASAIFPFVMNLVFGFSIPTDIYTILLFVMIGLGLYFLYVFGKIIYAILGFAEKSAKVIAYPITAKSQKKKKEMEKKIEELVKEREDKKKTEKKKAKKKKRIKEGVEEENEEDETEIVYGDDEQK
jgi:sensor histidine kinase YesM